MTNALIIFVKNLIPGTVKTRLSKSLGEENALKVYQQLLVHTNSITRNISADKYVFYSDYIEENDLWENEVYKKAIQQGRDLGERMKNAFDDLFNKCCKNVIIIGSDCYDLNEDIIAHAFEKLKETDIVIGPAKDGGYYLLGMKVLMQQFFTGKSWSTNNVLKETIANIEDLHYSFYQLPQLNDVDVAEDINFTY